MTPFDPENSETISEDRLRSVADILGVPDSLAEDVRVSIAHKAMTFNFEYIEAYSGRTPHPNHIQLLENIRKGLGTQIIDETIEEARHIRSLDTKIVDAGIKSDARGQWFAFILGAIIVSGGLWLLGSGRSLEGFGAIGTVGAAIIYAMHRADSPKGAEKKDVQ